MSIRLSFGNRRRPRTSRLVPRPVWKAPEPKPRESTPVVLVDSASDAAPALTKVISLCVFQNSSTDTRAIQRYHDAIPAVIRSLVCLAPDWRIVVHHDSSIFRHRYGCVLRKLAEYGLLDLHEMPSAPLCKAMLWRMRPCWYEGVDVVACRDMDALFLVRDIACLQSFLKSNAVIHNIKDNPGHVFPLMGGMSAYRTSALKSTHQNWDAFIDSAGRVDWRRYGSDEEFLRNHIFRQFKQSYLNHDISGKPTNVLDRSLLSGLSAQLIDKPELAPHIGVQIFDHHKAVAFYDKYNATLPIREAERSCAAA